MTQVRQTQPRRTHRPRTLLRPALFALAAATALTACAAPDTPVRPDGASTVAALPIVESANEVLPWAFVVNDPALPGVTPPDPDEVVTVPGSALSLRRRDIRIDNGPPDWHPEGRPIMPEIVARGREGVLPCGYCHLPNGMGKPENAGLAGQPEAYLIQQMEDYRKGLRRTGEARMGPPNLMMGVGAAASDEDARVAAAYFASLPFRRHIRVLETDSVPVTRFAGSLHEVVEGGGMEPIGERVVELPDDLERMKLRDDAVSFIAYVPPGAVARGGELARTGGGGRTVMCATCHGPDLRGSGPVPALAGRSPSYLARQLYDFRTGKRNGLWADLMDETVSELSHRDVVDLVAYLGSLEP
jgi:cytochrome c553